MVEISPLLGDSKYSVGFLNGGAKWISQPSTAWVCLFEESLFKTNT